MKINYKLTIQSLFCDVQFKHYQNGHTEDLYQCFHEADVNLRSLTPIFARHLIITFSDLSGLVINLNMRFLIIH